MSAENKDVIRPSRVRSAPYQKEKNSQGGLLQALRQGKLSSLGQLNTALKTDFVRPENDAESNSKNNSKNLKRGWPDYFGKFL